MKLPVRTIVALVLITGIIVMAGCQGNPITLNRQAEQYIKQNKFSKAQAVLQQSLKADFERAETHYWLGYCYEQQRLLDQAIYEYGLAISFDPTLTDAQVALARAYYMNGKENKSLSITRTFLRDKVGTTDDFINIARTFLKYNMDQQALMALDKATQVDTYNNAKALVLLGDYYLAHGNRQKGLDYLVQAFKKNPLYPGLAKRLGRYGLRVGIPQAKQPAGNK